MVLHTVGVPSRRQEPLLLLLLLCSSSSSSSARAAELKRSDLRVLHVFIYKVVCYKVVLHRTPSRNQNRCCCRAAGHERLNQSGVISDGIILVFYVPKVQMRTHDTNARILLYDWHHSYSAVSYLVGTEYGPTQQTACNSDDRREGERQTTIL